MRSQMPTQPPGFPISIIILLTHNASFQKKSVYLQSEKVYKNNGYPSGQWELPVVMAQKAKQNP